MSIFVTAKALEAENRKYKRSARVSKKVKLPTQLKTKKCSLELYNKKCKAARHTVNNGKSIFMLCDYHFGLYSQQHERFNPSYLKATILQSEKHE